MWQENEKYYVEEGLSSKCKSINNLGCKGTFCKSNVRCLNYLPDIY